MVKVGTWEWVEKRDGRLNYLERLTMTAQGVIAKIAAHRRVKSGLKIRYREVDNILPPDTPIAREATALCAEASEPYLFNHCLRSY